MSIKAGRVGVNPSQVDPVDGSLKSSATSGYTKQETDAKFLTQADAASTYESKSDASTAHNALQPKTLAVPIEMLSGTKLSVETALQGLNDEKQNMQLSVPIEMLVGSQLVPKTTVEAVLQTMDEAMTNQELSQIKTGNVTYEAVVTPSDIAYSTLKKVGRVVYFSARINALTVAAWADVGIIPEGYRPVQEAWVCCSLGGYPDTVCRISTNGYITFANENVNNKNVTITAMWITAE